MFLLLVADSFKTLRQIAISPLFLRGYGVLKRIKSLKTYSRQVLRRDNCLYCKNLSTNALKSQKKLRGGKMVNLLDGIRKLKERRQKARQAVKQVTEAPDDLAELITFYKAIGEKSQAVRGENAKPTDKDKYELERMEKSFSFRWNNLSSDKQKELVARLLEKGLLPDIVKQAIDIFNGTVVSLV